MIRLLGISTLLLTIVPCLAGTTRQSSLTLDERVAAQRAIEEVYWSHRIWPKDNPAPKPSFSAIVSDEVLRAKVVDYLEKSSAMERWWGRPVAAAQLQAELERMSRETRNPKMLQELYAALNDDAFVIAETLARATLADRLIRSWYASDDRIHRVERNDVEQALRQVRSTSEMNAIGGQYLVSKIALRAERGSENEEYTRDSNFETVVYLDADEWKRWTDNLPQLFGMNAPAIPLERLSSLQEDTDRLFVLAVLSFTESEAVVATVSWPKASFEEWWEKEREKASTAVELEPDAPYVVSLPQVVPCQDDTWEEQTYVPAPRNGHTAVWTGVEMIVWGGWSGHDLATGGRYNPATGSWMPTSTGADAPSSRNFHTAVWTGTEMIVWGGSGFGALNTGGRYDPVMDHWTRISTGVNTPVPRFRHTAVWTGSEMIVWGGIGGGALSSGGRYNPSTDSWLATSTGTNVPSGREYHSAVWAGTEMIVWGGSNGNTEFSSGGRYNPAANSWSPTTNVNVPSARSEHTALWTGTEMIIWGGSVNTGARYNPTLDSWIPTSTGFGVPSKRREHSAVWTGTEMIVWGGLSGAVYVDTGARYDPSKDSWVATAEGTNVPSKRTFHTAVWTGTEMIVWGGWNGVFFNTGGRYEPLTDSWIPTASKVNEPWPRSYHTAVWTGAEMIVWGGSSYIILNTGGRYDPSTGSWTPTSMGANVPSPRYFHTAVWSGSEMIVWGGSGEGGITASGGRYNPATDSWTATSTGPNVPTRRQSHDAVWTGTEMIVWGGWAAPQTETGGRYNPSTDSWLPTSTGANVPSAREGPSVVWTGTEMIVWGGNNGHTSGFYYDNGGRYDPLTDSWLPTSTDRNVPLARLDHRAVWTGREMIVWGGRAYGSVVLNTGGRYDPVMNEWAPTSTGLNVPLPDYSHVSVWTGTEMILWGGAETGGRYHPSTDSWRPMSSTNSPTTTGGQEAVWTGTQMVVWGGSPADSTVGNYCASFQAVIPGKNVRGCEARQAVGARPGTVIEGE